MTPPTLAQEDPTCTGTSKQDEESDMYGCHLVGDRAIGGISGGGGSPDRIEQVHNAEIAASTSDVQGAKEENTSCLDDTTTPTNRSWISVPVQEDDFKCPVCLDLLHYPLSLPCGHTFCGPCLARSSRKVQVDLAAAAAADDNGQGPTSSPSTADNRAASPPKFTCRCPICRSESFMSALPRLNSVLSDLIWKHLPEATARRREESDSNRCEDLVGMVPADTDPFFDGNSSAEEIQSLVRETIARYVSEVDQEEEEEETSNRLHPPPTHEEVLDARIAPLYARNSQGYYTRNNREVGIRWSSTPTRSAIDLAAQELLSPPQPADYRDVLERWNLRQMENNRMITHGGASATSTDGAATGGLWWPEWVDQDRGAGGSYGCRGDDGSAEQMSNDGRDADVTTASPTPVASAGHKVNINNNEIET